jgi:hypothetical protein
MLDKLDALKEQRQLTGLNYCGLWWKDPYDNKWLCIGNWDWVQKAAKTWKEGDWKEMDGATDGATLQRRTDGAVLYGATILFNFSYPRNVVLVKTTTPEDHINDYYEWLLRALMS